MGLETAIHQEDQVEKGISLNQFKAGGISKLFLLLGIVGAIGTLASFFVDKKQFAFSYLVAVCFFLCLALGALWFVLMQHLTRAGWSVVIRRIAENISANLPWMALFILPLALFNLHDLFHWTHEGIELEDPVIAKKLGYLNTPFFWVRLVLYFAVWTWLSRKLLSKSVEQDRTGDKTITLKLQKMATYGTVLYALTETFFAFDWIMGLNAHWFSTIFGVYYFACSAVGFFSLTIILTQALRKAGYLKGIMTVEHDHDLGKLLFGFNIFWNYIAFSQFLLIWYANLGEETPFYHMRATGDWKTLSLIMPVIHFVIPFFFFISRVVKRNSIGLTTAAIWLFVVNYIDIFWLIMPNHSTEGPQYGWMDVSSVLFVGGFFFYLLLKRMEKSSLVPEKDPRLSESLHFKNM
jgi:hypothetical protein